MSGRMRSTLVILIPTLLGMLVMTALLRLHTVPLWFNDTSGFMAAARLDQAWIGYRTPLYGWLVIGALGLGLPMLPVWIQILAWLSCIAAFTALVLVLTKSNGWSVLAGTLFVAIETVIMYSPGSQWFLITDPLASDVLALGLFLLLLGVSSDSRALLWIGTASLGLGILMRPLPVPVALGIVILASGKPIRALVFNKRFLGGVAMLLFPLLMLCAWNKVFANHFSPTPLRGLTVSYYTKMLLRPDDRIFEDPILDRVFHEAVTFGIVHPDHAGFDPFYMKPYKWASPIFTFYASLSNTPNAAEKRFEISDMSASITTRLILRHPLTYIRLSVPRIAQTLVPTRAKRHVFFMRPNPFEFEALIGYDWQSAVGLQRRLGGGLREPHERDMRIGTIMDAEWYGIRLPEDFGPKTAAFVTLATIGMLGESIRRLRDKATHSMGIAILVCLSNTYFNALFVGTSTLLDDPRYSLPGIMTGTAAIILTLVSVSMERKSGIVRAHP